MMGFDGKLVLAPEQVRVVHEAYRPTSAELERTYGAGSDGSHAGCRRWLRHGWRRISRSRGHRARDGDDCQSGGTALSKCLHLVLCAAAILIDGYDVQTMGLAIPSLAKATGLPPQNFGVVITAGVTGMAVGAIMLAPLADRFGRKLAMVVALLAIALSTLGMTSVEMPIELSGWRFVSGLGLGALLPVTRAGSEHCTAGAPDIRFDAHCRLGRCGFVPRRNVRAKSRESGWLAGIVLSGSTSSPLPITGLLATRAVVGEGKEAGVSE
jgi:hypothetical protein